MKKKFTTLTFLGLLFCQFSNLNAQVIIERSSLRNNGEIGIITFKKGTLKNSLNFKDKKSDNNIHQILKLPSNISLVQYKIEDGFKNFSTEYYQAYLNGYPIEGLTYKVLSKQNELISLSGKLQSFTNELDETSKISENEAFKSALNYVNAEKYDFNNTSKSNLPKGELVYVIIDQGENNSFLTLAYKFDIFATKPLSRDYIYVDAHSGIVIKTDPILKHINNSHLETKIQNKVNLKEVNKLFDTGNADTRYSGRREINTTLTNNGYILKDTSRGLTIETLNLNKEIDLSKATNFIDVDNNWTEAEYKNANKDDGALDAHWGVTTTYDYFKNRFNRYSYDNQGAKLLSYVHYGIDYANAAWYGSFMVYGDGNSTSYDILTSLDVTAHELGHAVCSSTANLEYQRESGAINEGLSDIWAALVENNSTPEKSPFLIGEDINLSNVGYMRSMSDPKSAGQPNTYKGQNWVYANLEEGCINPNRDYNDHCGVHTNSGVLNHWFYILVSGKKGTNDIGNAYDVAGIGFEKAAEIVYLTETSYLTPTSNFKHVRNSAIESSITLYGENSPERIAVQDAFYAVGIGDKYSTNPDVIAPSAPANLTASNITGDGVTLNWDSATDSNGIGGYILLQDNKQIATLDSTTYRVNGLNKLTTYNFVVKAFDNSYNESTTSNVAQVSTIDMAKPCVASGNNTYFFRIGKVKLNTIDNLSTGLKGYEDFSYLTTEVKAGQSYTIQITPTIENGYKNLALTYAVFLDHNDLGIFGTNKKLAEIKDVRGDNPINLDITIPNNIKLDKNLRLRVIQFYNYENKTLNGCDDYIYGQVEDYAVIAKTNLGIGNINKDEIKIYPNPVKDILNIELNNKNDFDYQIVNVTGSVVKIGKSNGKIDVNSLNSGVYIIKINQGDTELTHKFVKK